MAVCGCDTKLLTLGIGFVTMNWQPLPWRLGWRAQLKATWPDHIRDMMILCTCHGHYMIWEMDCWHLQQCMHASSWIVRRGGWARKNEEAGCSFNKPYTICSLGASLFLDVSIPLLTIWPSIHYYIRDNVRNNAIIAMWWYVMLFGCWLDTWHKAWPMLRGSQFRRVPREQWAMPVRVEDAGYYFSECETRIYLCINVKCPQK